MFDKELYILNDKKGKIQNFQHLLLISRLILNRVLIEPEIFLSISFSNRLSYP